MDYSQMRFPFNPQSKPNLIELYPELSSYEAFTKIDSQIRNLALMYIFLMYDENSPFVRKYRDHNTRAKYICVTLSVVDEDKRAALVDFNGGSGETVKHAVLEYLIRIARNRVWTKIVANERMFEELTQELMTQYTEADEAKKMQALERKAKARTELDKIDEDLKAYWKQLTEGDDKLEKLAFQKISTPENRAKYA